MSGMYDDDELVYLLDVAYQEALDVLENMPGTDEPFGFKVRNWDLAS